MLVASILLCLLFLGGCPKAAQTPQREEPVGDWPCAGKVNLARDKTGAVVRLESEDMMSRVTYKTPVEEPMKGHLNLEGSVTVEVVVNSEGTIECVRATKGHALAVGAVVRAVQSWRFKPFVVGGKPTAVLGRLTIPYSFKRSSPS